MSMQPTLEEPDRRAGQPMRAALTGQFIVNGRGLPCHIEDVSRNGANIKLATTAMDDADCIVARLRIDGLRLFDVRIRWRSAHGIGLTFEKGRLSAAEIAALSSTG